MKKLVLVSLLLLASPAFATQISISCLCSYDNEGLMGLDSSNLPLNVLRSREELAKFQILLVPGTRKNPSADELVDCKIKEGKVIEGCWAAKMNALYNCQTTVRNMINPGSMSMPSVHIDEKACYGAIEQ